MCRCCLLYRRATKGVAAAAAAGTLDMASIFLFTALSAFHTLGLFSVGILMGEGRLQCVLLAAATLLLLKASLQAVLRARKLAATPAPANGTGVTSDRPQQSETEVLGSTMQHSAAHHANGLPCDNGGTIGLQTGQTSHVSVVSVICAAVVMLVCNVLLQALGLIDRSGQDPHDKTQPAAELMVGPDAAVQRVGLLCFTVGPVIAIWVGAVWLSAWLQQTATAKHLTSDSLANTVLHGVLPLFVKMCGTVCYISLGAFWVAQLTGCNDMTLGPAVGLLLSQVQHFATVPAELQNSVARVGTQLFKVLGLTSVHQVLSAAESSSLVMSVMRLPLRLLLPRVVYISCLWAFGTSLLIACVLPPLTRFCRMASLPFASQRKVVACADLQQQAVSTVSCQSLVWLCTAFAAAQIMVLGYKGPATMLLAIIQGACCCVMLCAHSAAHCDIIGSSQANLLKHAGHDGHTLDTGSGARSKLSHITSKDSGRDFGVQCVVGSGLWSMMSLQLFFCSSHFCEFSGLQYASAFIGVDNMATLASGSLLMLNSCGFLFLGCLTLQLMLIVSSSAGQQSGTSFNAAGQGVPVPLLQLQLTSGVMVFNSMRFAALAVCMLSAAVQQQHILLWAIFAPKLVFELVFMIVTNVGHFLAAVLSEQLFCIGVHHNKS